MHDVGYLCANFRVPRPLCSRVRPGVRDERQTDVRQKQHLMPPPIRGRGIITVHDVETRKASITVSVTLISLYSYSAHCTVASSSGYVI